MIGRRAAFAIAAMSAVFVVGAAVLMGLSWDAPVPDAWGFRGYGILQASAFTAVGTLVALRRRSNAVGWLLLVAGVLGGLGALGIAYGAFTLVGGHPDLPFGASGAWLGSWLWAPIVSFILPLVLLRFPDGELISPRLRIVEWFSLISSSSLASYMAFRPGPLQLATFVDNPFALADPVLLGVCYAVGVAGFAAIAAAAGSVVVRFRRSAGIERLQLKWLAVSVVPLAVTGVASGVLPDKFGQVLYVLLQLFIPIAIGIAILRYRLYDVDLLIRRTLIYTSLSAVLLAAYIAVVAVLQAALAPFTNGNGVAVAVSTLAVVALFQPVRRRRQVGVDRRFSRAQYDAVGVLDAFSTQLRDEVDLDAVRRGLVAAVEHTVQPVHASVWLRGPAR
ncbi:MAG: hypothetical protein NVS9B6_17290 [Candidatus Limnocylindrales bacterium]